MSGITIAEVSTTSHGRQDFEKTFIHPGTTNKRYLWALANPNSDSNQP